MKSKILLFVFSATILCISCQEPCYNIWIKNNAPNGINSILGYNFPDTLLPETNSGIIYVKSNSESGFGNIQKWEDVINTLPNRTISIFILDTAIVKTIPWDTIRSNNNILKRYNLTADSLIKSNWIVIYP